MYTRIAITSIDAYFQHGLLKTRHRPGGGETICPAADGSSTVAYRFAANQAVCASPRIQESRRIYVRPRTSPQSAHLWWPAVAKLQAASVPIA